MTARRLAAYRLRLPAHCLLAYCLLPTAYCLLTDSKKRCNGHRQRPFILSQGVGEWGDAAKDVDSSGRCVIHDTGSRTSHKGPAQGTPGCQVGTKGFAVPSGVTRPVGEFTGGSRCRRRDSNPHAVSRNGF